MSENFSFRSSMNGFNRNDVISYIEGLIQEKQNAEFHAIALQKEINELKAEITSLKALVDAANSKSEADKCSECDVSKIYEARLGAAMLDAKRFSEILVKEANDKAADLFAEAFDAVDATSVKASEISRNITEISGQFNDSFKELADNINSLRSKLNSFKGDVESTGGMFNFKTDFDDSAAADNDEASKSDVISTDSLMTKNKFAAPATPKSNVNFDDADEYDFMVDVNA